MATFDRTGISMPQEIGQPKNETKKKDQRNKYEIQKIKFNDQSMKKMIQQSNRSNEIQTMVKNNKIEFHMVTA